jgi:2-keto-3-deoxy-galactonokinase
VDLARRDGPLASLFKARSLPVLEGLPPAEASALLSGALIAGEALERVAAAPREARDGPLLVAGAVALRDLYLRALERLGIEARGVPPEVSAAASVRGLIRLRELLL